HALRGGVPGRPVGPPRKSRPAGSHGPCGRRYANPQPGPDSQWHQSFPASRGGDCRNEKRGGPGGISGLPGPACHGNLAIHMAAMNDFHPRTGTDEQWNAAYYRLEDYLRAHGVVSKVHQSQVISLLLGRAAAAHEKSPERSPLELSLCEAYDEMVRWF